MRGNNHDIVGEDRMDRLDNTKYEARIDADSDRCYSDGDLWTDLNY